MILRVLGASGAEFPGMNPPSFLLDGTMLLDAGTIGSVLSEEEQWAIKHILITHAHLDHIKGIPFLADNLVLRSKEHTVIIMGTLGVLGALKGNLLNNLVWPDFTEIPSVDRPILATRPLYTGDPYDLNGYTITAYDVNHSVEAVGYLVESADGRRLVYTGDTGPTQDLWRAMDKPVHCLIIETSLPNSMHEMAAMTGHLTAELMGRELKKMKHIPERICITHPKPQYAGIIAEEVAALGFSNIVMLREGEEIEI